MRPLRSALPLLWLLWHTSVSVSISAVSGKGDYWQAPGARRPSSENPDWPGHSFLCVPTLPPGGPGVPGSAALRSGSACGPRPRPLTPIYGLPPRPHFPVPPDGFCCGRKTMPRPGLPGRLFLQGREASLPPVWPALYPACPGRYAAFPGPGLPFPVPYEPYLSFHYRVFPARFGQYGLSGCPFRSPPVPGQKVPCRPVRPPAAYGQKAGAGRRPAGISRPLASGHVGPKWFRFPPGRPRPQSGAAGRGRRFPGLPVSSGQSGPKFSLAVSVSVSY